MFSLWIAADAERDELIADLWSAGTTGITEEDDGVRAFFEDGADVIGLERYRPTRGDVDTKDWVGFVREQWPPFAVGRSWWLAPEWDRGAVPTGRTLLRIYPGMACGTGWHAATQLCLTAMEDCIQPGNRVLDVGTGSGILADAAILLGASPVWGCDIEHAATLIAQANTVGRVGLFTGSIRSVRSASVDVLVANLNMPTLLGLRGEMARVLRSGGIAILSGFREEEAAELTPGANQLAELEQDGWACLVVRYS